MSEARMIMNEIADVPGTSVSYTAGEWLVTDRDGHNEIAKGIKVAAASAGGNIDVHLKDNPAGIHSLYAVPAGGGTEYKMSPGIFDRIYETTTTVPLADITILI